MAKRALQPPNLTFLPKPEYPYSPGSTAGGFVYTSGQVAWDDHGQLVGLGRSDRSDATGALERGVRPP